MCVVLTITCMYLSIIELTTNNVTRGVAIYRRI